LGAQRLNRLSVEAAKAILAVSESVTAFNVRADAGDYAQ
jgi:hypothetical protein